MPLVAALMLLLAGAASPAPDIFDDLYARGQQRNGAVATVHANFTETTTSTLLRDPLVAHGTLVAQMPARLRLDYTSPDRRTVIVDEHHLTMSATGASPRIVRDITTTQERVKKYFVNKSPAELRKHFTLRAFADPDLPGTYQVQMVPTRKQIREGLSELRIWIDADTLFLRQMRMVFPGGDTKTFVLDRVRLDLPVAPGTFETAETRTAAGN
jgi:outer membrane lipoprotein-sorting protein